MSLGIIFDFLSRPTHRSNSIYKCY
jgi:hypothetical protein